MDHYVITIARGFGSGGRQIAALLADRLGIHSYEHRILALASQYSGLSSSIFEETEEKLPDRRFLGRLHGLQKRTAAVPELDKFTSDDHLYDIESEVILKLAEEESCIIVGKCADYVLRNHPHTLTVYIDAPREFCRLRIMKRMMVDADRADAVIESTDQYRADYYHYYTKGKRWDDPMNYDLTINSGKWGLEKSVDIIEKALYIRFPELVRKSQQEQ